MHVNVTPTITSCLSWSTLMSLQSTSYRTQHSTALHEGLPISAADVQPSSYDTHPSPGDTCTVLFSDSSENEMLISHEQLSPGKHSSLASSFVHTKSVQYDGSSSSSVPLATYLTPSPPLCLLNLISNESTSP